MGDGPRFVDTRVPSPITEMVCLVTSNVNGNDHWASGTAVIVAPFLALCARHVLDDHFERHEGRAMQPGDNAGTFSFVLAQLVENRLNLWTVTRLWTSGATDIAVFSLTPFSEGARTHRFRRPVLELLPPAVGQSIHAFGYHSNQVSIQNGEIVLQQAAATTHGVVVEVHPRARDTVLMPYPCFRTNARFDGGMSGGPVFNQAGHLCGMIGSTYQAFTQDEQDASYAMLLWAAMAIVVDIERPGQPHGTRYPLYELTRDNTIEARNGDLITVGELGDTGTPRISIRIP